MYPYPTHFIIRHPGERIVPVIAVDQLPDWVRLAGVPREMDAQQAVGMTNLGNASSILDDSGDEHGYGAVPCYEVQLRTDRIRAILSGRGGEEEDQSVGTSSPGSSLSMGRASEIKKGKKKKKKGKGKGKGRGVTGLPPDTRVDSERTSSSSKCDLEDQRDSDAIEASIIDFDTGSDSIVVSPIPSISSHIERRANAKAHIQQTEKTRHQESLPKQIFTTEPMLSASQYNTTAPDSLLDGSTAACGNEERQLQAQQTPIGPHMTEEMPRDQEKYHQHQHQHVTRRTIRDNSPNTHHHHQHRSFGVHGGNPETLFCRHWCHHGTCKWGWGCRYQHRMPMDAEGLRDVGLRDFPTWFLLLMGGSGDGGGYVPHSPAGAAAMPSSPSSSSSAMILGKASGGINHSDRQDLLDKNDFFTQPFQHHPADALLGPGGGGTMITTATRQQQLSQAHHHPSPIDLRLMQGRMPALLSGSTTMSNKQKRKKIKEMQELFLRSSSSSSSPHNIDRHQLTDSAVAGMEEYPHHHSHEDHSQLPRPHQHHHHHHNHKRQSRPKLQSNVVSMKANAENGLAAADPAGTMRRGAGGSDGHASPPELELELELTPRDGDDEGTSEMDRLSPVSSENNVGRIVREGKLIDVD